MVATLVATIWALTLLPALLGVGLLAALLLVPVLRQLRRELEQMESERQGGRHAVATPVVNATPWQQRLRNWWRR